MSYIQPSGNNNYLNNQHNNHIFLIICNQNNNNQINGVHVHNYNQPQLSTQGINNNCCDLTFKPNQIFQVAQSHDINNSILSPLLIHQQQQMHQFVGYHEPNINIMCNMNTINNNNKNSMNGSFLPSLPSVSSVSCVEIPVQSNPSQLFSQHQRNNVNVNVVKNDRKIPNMQSNSTRTNPKSQQVTLQSAYIPIFNLPKIPNIPNIQNIHNINVTCKNNMNLVENEYKMDIMNNVNMNIHKKVQNETANIPKMVNGHNINHHSDSVDINHDNQCNHNHFKCDQCKKSFSRQSNLIQHRRIHSGERPFICKWCNRSFTQKHSLTNHVRIHTGERPFACDICHKRFNVKYNLKTHRRIHTGEKPYSCTLCNRHFTSRSGLNSHTKHIHRGKINTNLNKNLMKIKIKT